MPNAPIANGFITRKNLQQRWSGLYLQTKNAQSGMNPNHALF